MRKLLIAAAAEAIKQREMKMRKALAGFGIGVVLATAVACSSSTPSSPSSGSSPSSHSPSYQAGYNNGASGNAHQNALAGMGMNDTACSQTWIADLSLQQNETFDEQQWTQGCMDGLRDHPPAKNPGNFGTP